MLRWPLCVAALGFMSVVSPAATMVFGDAYQGYARSVSIVLNNSAPNQTNFSLAAGSTSGFTNRGLLRFDVSALAGQYSSITSIRLDLTTLHSGPSGILEIFAVARENGAWTGLSATDSSGQSSWNLPAQSGAPWAGSPGLSTPGVDYDPRALATFAWNDFIATSTLTSITFTGSPERLTALIDSWLSEENEGLLFRTTDENPPASTLIVFREPAYPFGTDQPPALTITYDPVPEPSTLGGVALGLLLIGARKRRSLRCVP